MIASKQLPDNLAHGYELIGELALSGALRPVSSCLPIAIAVEKVKRSLIVPVENAEEAGLVESLEIYPANSLLHVCGHLLNKQAITNNIGLVKFFIRSNVEILIFYRSYK